MAEPGAANPRPNVLIVDDQPRNLDVLEVMLADMGCTLIRATSADEALLCLVRNDFAALVLDIRMPGMSGIRLATLVRTAKALAARPDSFSHCAFWKRRRRSCAATASAPSIT